MAEVEAAVEEDEDEEDDEKDDDEEEEAGSDTASSTSWVVHHVNPLPATPERQTRLPSPFARRSSRGKRPDAGIVYIFRVRVLA